MESASIILYYNTLGESFVPKKSSECHPTRLSENFHKYPCSGLLYDHCLPVILWWSIHEYMCCKMQHYVETFPSRSLKIQVTWSRYGRRGCCWVFFPKCNGFTGLINRNAASIKCVDLSLHVSVPCILGPGDSFRSTTNSDFFEWWRWQKLIQESIPLPVHSLKLGESGKCLTGNFLNECHDK